MYSYAGNVFDVYVLLCSGLDRSIEHSADTSYPYGFSPYPASQSAVGHRTDEHKAGPASILLSHHSTAPYRPQNKGIFFLFVSLIIFKFQRLYSTDMVTEP